jgi:hypothetical protein
MNTQAMVTTALPTSIKRVQQAVGVVVLVHLVALLLLLTHRGVIHGTVLSDHPGWSGDQVDSETNSLVWQSVVPHILIPLLLIFRARALKSRRPGARTFLTVLLAIQLAAHATLPITLHELPGYTATIVTVQAISLAAELTALYHLWLTPTSRTWFAKPEPTDQP